MAALKDKLVTVESLDYVHDTLQGKLNNVNNTLKASIQSTNNALSAKIQEVSDSLSDRIVDTMETGSIPEYWLPALEAGAKEINTKLCEAGRNKSAFLFYSDVHWDYGAQMSPKLLKYLYEHTGISKTFFGGDMVNTESSDYDAMQYLWVRRNMLRYLPNHHSVVGNHDDGNATNNLFSEQYVYGYVFAPEETPDMVWGDGLYYYIDNQHEKTRYIFLDTGYQTEAAKQTKMRAFLADTLKSTANGWHIVVVSHIWYGPDYDQYNVKPIPIAGLSKEAVEICAVLDNYNSRSGNFASCGAKVEFCIGGHVHIDYTNTTEGGIPIILVETDSQHVRSTYTYAAGTTSEASVNGIVADFNTNMLHVIRVGRGDGFSVDLSSAQVAKSYSVTSYLTNAANSSSATHVVDGGSYTATITATKGALKSVVVTMGGTDITSTAYNASTGKISIATVTGAIVITATAQEDVPETPDTPDTPDVPTGNYTNVLRTAVDTDDSIYNGVGWQADREMSTSSYVERDASNGWDLTGYIHVYFGDVIRLKNIVMPDGVTDRNNMIYRFDGAKNWEGSTHMTTSAQIDTIAEPQFDGDGNLVQFTWQYNYGASDGGYVRINATQIDETSIITINEEIVESTQPDEPISPYTNVMKLSIASDGTPFADGKGWMANSRIGSGGIYAGNQTPGTDNAQWVTGYIPIEGFGTRKFNIYLKNVIFNSESTNGNHAVYFFDENFAKISPKTTGSPTHFSVDGLKNYFANDGIDADGNFTKISFSPSNSADNTSVKYFAICCGGLSDDSIITIDEDLYNLGFDDDSGENGDSGSTNLFVASEASV